MDDIRAGSRGFCDNVSVMPSAKDIGGGKGPSDGKTAVLPTSTSEIMAPAPESSWGGFITGVGDYHVCAGRARVLKNEGIAAVADLSDFPAQRLIHLRGFALDFSHYHDFLLLFS